MRWSFEKTHCFCLEHSEFDLLAEILESTHDALRSGLLEMSNSELVDFDKICDQAGLTLHPLKESDLPALRRIK